MNPAPLNEVYESPRFPELIIEHVRYSLTGRRVRDPWFYGTLKSDEDFVLVGKSQRDVEKQYARIKDNPKRLNFQ